jgi:hypothetical protein
VREEDGAARGLRRVRRQNELERDVRPAPPHVLGRDTCPLELAECGRERLLRDPRLVLGTSSAADAVHLLRHVDELEVERERAQHA